MIIHLAKRLTSEKLLIIGIREKLKIRPWIWIQNQSTDKLLSIYINLKMPVMQKIAVEQGIHFLEIK